MVVKTVELLGILKVDQMVVSLDKVWVALLVAWKVLLLVVS
jgi:hypothetical protein